MLTSINYFSLTEGCPVSAVSLFCSQWIQAWQAYNYSDCSAEPFYEYNIENFVK